MPPKKKDRTATKKKASDLAGKKVKKKVTEKKEREPAEPFTKDDVGAVRIGGVYVIKGEGLMPTWVLEKERWHINLRHSEREGVYHISREGSPMVHYYFTGTGTDIVGVQPSAKERGSSSTKKVDGEDVRTKLTFDDLPDAVQTYVKTNWSALLK